MTVSLSSSVALMTDVSSRSVRKLIEAHPSEEARGRERDNAGAHSETVRMCRAPAELSIQSSLRRGQKRQEGGTPLGN